MVFQVAAISAMLISIRHEPMRMPAIALMWAVVFFAVLSAVSYFRKFWRKIDERIKQRRRRELLILERKRQKALRRQMGLSSGKEGLGAATIWKPPEVN
jgi:CDP-diacylglycerol--glycerol-3-phosphate 3-phosphatidyltransferase